MRESVDADPARWFASIPAYFTLAWRGQLGPLLPIGVVAAVALWRRKAPGRWSLAAWWLALPLALSLVPKKNAYYGFYAFAAAPVLIASGLSLARSRRAWVALAAGTVVATLGWSVWRMSRVAPDLPQVDGAPVFEQSSDYALRAPETGVYDGSTGAFVADVLSARRANERRLLVVLDARDANERLRYEMLMRDPASELMMLARAGRVPPVGVDPIFAAAPGDGSELTFAEVIERVRRDLRVGAGGPVEGYLEELSHRAGEYGVVGRVGEWVLFDHAAGATGTAS
jgi:hypothetical protein